MMDSAPAVSHRAVAFFTAVFTASYASQIGQYPPLVSATTAAIVTIVVAAGVALLHLGSGVGVGR